MSESDRSITKADIKWNDRVQTAHIDHDRNPIKMMEDENRIPVTKVDMQVAETKQLRRQSWNLNA